MQQEEDVQELAESSISAVSTGKKRSFTQKDSKLILYSVFNQQRKVVHLIRHGHTTYRDGCLRTKSGKYPFDVILSPLGIQQALALKDKIPGLGAEVILTSPLTRALQTLQNAVDLTQVKHFGLDSDPDMRTRKIEVLMATRNAVKEEGSKIEK